MPGPEELSSQADLEVLAALRWFARMEGRQFQDVLEEAMLAHLEWRRGELVATLIQIAIKRFTSAVI